MLARSMLKPTPLGHKKPPPAMPTVAVAATPPAESAVAVVAAPPATPTKTAAAEPSGSPPPPPEEAGNVISTASARADAVETPPSQPAVRVLHFFVQLPGAGDDGSRVGLVGSIAALRNWSEKDALVLERVEGQPGVWRATVDVPSEVEVAEYKYLLLPSGEEQGATRWERSGKDNRRLILSEVGPSHVLHDRWED